MAEQKKDVLLSAHLRSSRGSIIALTTCLTLVLVMLGLIFFYTSMLCEGSRQFRDAVDAGALSMIKGAMLEPSLRLSRSDDPDKVLEPLLEPYDGITLKNVNRLSAAALLIEMNQAAMNEDGTGTDQARRHAAQFNEKIADIAERFSRSVLDRTERKKSFARVSLANPTNMLGARSSVLPDQKAWGPAYINAGTASNIYIERKQYPKGLRPNIPTSEIMVRGERHHYIAGYMPLFTGADLQVRRPQMSFFMPLRPPLQPHLITTAEYEANMEAPRAVLTRYCIPNSFAAHGVVTEEHSGMKMEYSAHALAEAMDEGHAANLPSGFIRLENKSKETINIGDMIKRPRLRDLRERILQRLYEVDPDFEERQLDELLDIELSPRERAVITPANERHRPDINQRDVKPDGNSSLAPFEVEKIALQWIPSTGYNNLLAVIEIADVEPDDGPGRGDEGPAR